MALKAYYRSDIRDAITAIDLAGEGMLAAAGIEKGDAAAVIGFRLALVAMGQAFGVDVKHALGRGVREARQAVLSSDSG